MDEYALHRHGLAATASLIVTHKSFIAALWSLSTTVMKIHEYQGRQLLADAGVPVPAGAMVETLEHAEHAARKLFDEGAKQVVIKAQVHAGGR
jgi:hypothetical protein